MKQEAIEVTFEMLATKKQRLINAIADTVVISLLYLIVKLIIIMLYKFADIDGPMFWLNHASGVEVYLLMAAVAFIYYFICEAFIGGTMGKFITHTKVLSKEGRKASLKDIVLRNLVRLVPLEAFSFIGEYSDGWHDQFSDTIVVDIHRFDKEVRFRQHMGGINHPA